MATVKSFSTPHKPHNRKKFTLVIHGGAGTISRETATPEKQALYRAALKEALKAGHAVLNEGGEAMDAAVAAVTVLEGECSHRVQRDGFIVVPFFRLSSIQRGQGSCVQSCWEGTPCYHTYSNQVAYLSKTE